MTQTLGAFDPSGPKEIALFGIPGVGKTQISMQYSQRSRVDGWKGLTYDHHLMLNAKSPAIIEKELRRIAATLNLIDDAFITSTDTGVLVAKFQVWLSSNKNWLLVFDDVTYNNDVSDIRPKSGNGHVIYTTRNRITADALCSHGRTQELHVMDRDESVALIKAWMAGPASHQLLVEADAVRVADFTKGLPLVLEQIAAFAKTEKVSLGEALKRVEKKAELLQQKTSISFHKHNLAAGSALMTTFDALAERDSTAAALFQLLAYLEPSSISRTMLEAGAQRMEEYFARKSTYDRGAVRDQRRNQRRQQMLRIPTFHLLDFDGPFDARLYQRLLRTGEFRKNRQPRLPRADSVRDLEMQSYWQLGDAMQGVFDSRNQLNAALNEIESSGLIRKVDRNTLWIHDLYAELMTAYIEGDQTTSSSNADRTVHAHVAATMVWLAFPITLNMREMSVTSYEYLPHGESCLRHLHELGTLLMDATVGPELSQAVASTISHRGRFSSGAKTGVNVYQNPDVRKVEWLKAVRYYKDALRGYMAAHDRMMSDSRLRGWKGLYKVCQVAQRDIVIENESSDLKENDPVYTVDSWLAGGSRYGSTPLWRALQTTGQISMLYFEIQAWDEAIWWFQRCRAGMRCLFGSDENYNPEAEAVRECLVYAHQHKGQYDIALELLLEEKKVLEIHFGCQDLTQLFDRASVMEFSARIAGCYLGMKRYADALRWYELAYRGMKSAHGQYGYHMWGSIQDCRVACEGAGDWEGVLGWWFEALGVLLHARNQQIYRVKDFMEGFPIAVQRWRESLSGHVEGAVTSDLPQDRDNVNDPSEEGHREAWDATLHLMVKGDGAAPDEGSMAPGKTPQLMQHHPDGQMSQPQSLSTTPDPEQIKKINALACAANCIELNNTPSPHTQRTFKEPSMSQAKPQPQPRIPTQSQIQLYNRIAFALNQVSNLESTLASLERDEQMNALFGELRGGEWDDTMVESWRMGKEGGYI
jgi:hypothetical protein